MMLARVASSSVIAMSPDGAISTAATSRRSDQTLGERAGELAGLEVGVEATHPALRDGRDPVGHDPRRSRVGGAEEQARGRAGLGALGERPDVGGPGGDRHEQVAQLLGRHDPSLRKPAQRRGRAFEAGSGSRLGEDLGLEGLELRLGDDAAVTQLPGPGELREPLVARGIGCRGPEPASAVVACSDFVGDRKRLAR